MPEVFLSANWQKIIMANYELRPQVLGPYLPAHVELDDFEGKYLVSLVGFLFTQTKLFGVPVPFFGTFEEVNLRFYVRRKVDGVWRRGVVFINESVPYRPVAWLANVLYKEHYIALDTEHQWMLYADKQHIKYTWAKQRQYMHLKVDASMQRAPMAAGSAEHFIYEHYYGYTKVAPGETWEYRVNHPSWETYPVQSYDIDCDFRLMYGEDFAVLNHSKPHSLFLAEGSPVTVGWKRKKLKF